MIWQHFLNANFFLKNHIYDRRNVYYIRLKLLNTHALTFLNMNRILREQKENISTLMYESKLI